MITVAERAHMTVIVFWVKHCSEKREELRMAFERKGTPCQEVF
jgi:hypothetical protein